MKTTLNDQIDDIREAIEELTRRVIDEEETATTAQFGVYKIEVFLTKHFGEGISERAKNIYQIDIDISIPLESLNLYFAPRHYPTAKRLAKKWLGPDSTTVS